MSETIPCATINGTFVSANNPSTSFYASAKAFQLVSGASGEYQAFVYTALPAQMVDKQVLSATLTVRMVSGTGSRTLSVVRNSLPVPNAYAPMTWNSKPGQLVGATTHSVTQVATSTTWVFDVTADLTNIAAGGKFYGWRFGSSYTGAWQMYGWQSSDPVTLTVVLGDDASEPVGLRPDGVTSLAKPTLTWDAPDGILSAQAQIDSVGDDFSSPLFDTGTLATTEGEIDLATTAYAGLADGASVIARVRQTTETGTSAWSDPVTITRDAYGALTVTSPASTTTDPTPTAAWTFTGQTRYQVTLSSNGKTLAESGVLPGTASAWTPPKGAVSAGQVLSFRVRTWDGADRTSSPGDVGYVQSTVTTTYNPGAAPAVSSLAASQDGVSPWVDLDWTRTAGVPDEWVISRDGDIIDRIDAVSGGDPVWTYRDWTCPPNTDVAYTVTAFDGTGNGAQGPVAAVRTVVGGAWVFDPITGLQLRISGNGLALAYAESTVLYNPVGGSAPVKRTFALAGLEGTVEGVLVDFDGRTVAEQGVDLYAIKASPSKTYRFAAGDLNIPVVVSNLTTLVSPDFARTDSIIKAVSFSIAQVGELPFPEVTP